MSNPDALRSADASVVARYLQVRSIFHDQVLARLEQLVPARFDVALTRRINPTLLAQVRSGFERPEEGEIWPVIFINAVDIHLALCFQITMERLASLGTVMNGPSRVRHRSWEEWWGWEKKLSEVHSRLFDLPVADQHEALVQWFLEGFEWLAHSGLVMRRGHQ
jgi:hypothetical protein